MARVIGSSCSEFYHLVVEHDGQTYRRATEIRFGTEEGWRAAYREAIAVEAAIVCKDPRMEKYYSEILNRYKIPKPRRTLGKLKL